MSCPCAFLLFIVAAGWAFFDCREGLRTMNGREWGSEVECRKRIFRHARYCWYPSLLRICQRKIIEFLDVGSWGYMILVASLSGFGGYGMTFPQVRALFAQVQALFAQVQELFYQLAELCEEVSEW